MVLEKNHLGYSIIINVNIIKESFTHFKTRSLDITFSLIQNKIKLRSYKMSGHLCQYFGNNIPLTNPHHHSVLHRHQADKISFPKMISILGINVV